MATICEKIMLQCIITIIMIHIDKIQADALLRYAFLGENCACFDLIKLHMGNCFFAAN